MEFLVSLLAMFLPTIGRVQWLSMPVFQSVVTKYLNNSGLPGFLRHSWLPEDELLS